MRRAILFSLAAVLIALAPAGAQTSPFTIRVQQGANIQTITDGGTVALPAEAVGMPVTADITLTYAGTVISSFASIGQIAMTGSTDFSILGVPELPLVMHPATPATPAIPATPDTPEIPGTPAMPASQLTLRVRYNPANSRGASGRVTLTYTNEAGRVSTLSVNLTGTAPEFAYTYQVQPNGNTTLLSQGTTVQLPLTAFGGTASVLITLTNRGTGTGAVNGIGLGGSDRFALAGVQFLPASVDPNRTLQFSVQFSPTDFGAVSSDVQVDFVGSSLQFKVAGAGRGPRYEYAVVNESGAAVPLTAGGLVRLPDATVGGDKTSVTVRVANTGNDNGSVAAITLSADGTALALAEKPATPYALLPDGSVTFKIQFAPTQPGKVAGRLFIGGDSFAVEGTGLGPQLTYSYAAAGSASTVSSGGTVVLPAVAVGGTSTVSFTVTNEGTAPQDVFSISASGANSVFAVSGLPALPQSVKPGESVSVTVTFAPIALGAATGTLKVDTQTFTLSGVGNPPAALPSYSFSGTSGAVEPQQQPAIGLTLASSYGLALNGVLTLKFTSDVFADDPSVQFSSGGRTVSFTIPAGSRNAVFPNGSTQMRLQSGTVAGTVTMTPSFTTAAGGIDLTPATPEALTMTVAQSAPKITSVVVSSKANATVTLLVTGYATGRNITQMDFQFTAVSGENLGTSKVTIPVESTFNAWYQGSSSAAYGSQFTASVSFTLSGEIKDTKTISVLADTLQSVSVTLTNRQGVSSASSINLR